MRRILFTALLSGMLSAVYADGILSSIQKVQLLNKPHTVAYDRAMNNGQHLRIYNIQDGGFVMTQGQQILGYSDTGTFCQEDAPPALLDLLQALQDNSSIVTDEALQQESATSFKPLLGDIAWNQDSPYNDLCPQYDMATKCPTGCVATAMAQLMYYHKWPEQGKGQHSYQPAIMSGNTLEADFASTTYQWEAMLPNYASATIPAAGYTMEQCRSAVATLMLHCGIAVDMFYYSQSGAVDYDVPPALISYFQYDHSMAYRKREHYSTADWLQIIRNEIAEGRPVLAYGRSATGGHAYVFDGMDSQGFIHVNWGWGGMSNGFFRTSALTPASQGIGGSDGGFNYSQSIITGIRPVDRVDRDEHVELTSTEGLVAGKTKIAQNSAVNIRLSGKVTNHGWHESTFDYALLLLGEEGDTVSIIPGPASQALAKDDTGYAPSFGAVNLGTLPIGQYTLYPVCRVTGGKDCWIRIRDSYIGYVNRLDITATETELIFHQPNYFQLKATDLSLPKQIYSGVPALISTVVTNEGDVEYHGEVKAQLRQGSNIVGSTSNYIVDLLPGESTQLNFVDKFAVPAGSYTLCLVDDDGVVISSRMETTVAPKPSMGQVVAADAITIDKAGFEEFQATATVTVEDGFFAGLLYTFIYTKEGHKEVGCLFPEYVSLDGSEQKVTMSGAFENGQPGKYYQAELAVYDGSSYIFLTGEHAKKEFFFDPNHSFTGIRTASFAGKDSPSVAYDLQGRPTDSNASRAIIIIGGKKIVNSK